MSNSPTLVLIPGAWHKPACYDQIIDLLQGTHKLRCVAVTLPTTLGNRDATFKNDIDVVREAISRKQAKDATW
ncbi:alpha/beta-hydrolase [Apiospora kogelbergensis]|uniref:alpha/beta-hydrolase n=1 Tax=Apiospora kogelbergensis TaxID=1337665 RepID=UPI00312E1ECF